MRGFHDQHQSLEPGTCQPSASQAWRENSPAVLVLYPENLCVDFSKEPVQHKRLNSKCQKQREEEWEIKVLLSCFFESGFGCDWIEGLRLREREWR